MHFKQGSEGWDQCTMFIVFIWEGLRLFKLSDNEASYRGPCVGVCIPAETDPFAFAHTGIPAALSCPPACEVDCILPSLAKCHENIQIHTDQQTNKSLTQE